MTPEQFPYPTTTKLAAERARLAHGEGCRAPWTKPMRPRDSDAYVQQLGRDPITAEWNRFRIVFSRALQAMEKAPDGATTYDDNTETWVAHA